MNLSATAIRRQIITLYLGPKGVPVRVLVDSGASRSLIKLAVAELLGLELQVSSVTYRMRLANDQMSSDVMNTVIRDCSASALNGEVHVKISELLVTSSLPDCDMIMGRDVIFGLLRGVIHQDKLAGPSFVERRWTHKKIAFLQRNRALPTRFEQRTTNATRYLLWQLGTPLLYPVEHSRSHAVESFRWCAYYNVLEHEPRAWH